MLKTALLVPVSRFLLIRGVIFHGKNQAIAVGVTIILLQVRPIAFLSGSLQMLPLKSILILMVAQLVRLLNGHKLPQTALQLRLTVALGAVLIPLIIV